MSKRFINSPESVVGDLLNGVSLDSGRISLVNPGDSHYIAVRANVGKEPPIRIISGGGAGHEPFVFGYVGKGMLSGAVSGETFSSPSSSAISTCIESVAGGGGGATGILVVLMNYTGDRLNFGLAVENCTREGQVPIKVVTVKDDIVKGRGIAGTVLVLKIAGAAASGGRNLQYVERVANKAADSLASIGIALSPATLPGHPVDDSRLGEGEIEIGMGIHNEPGAFKQRINSKDSYFCDSLVQDLIGRLVEEFKKKPDLCSRSCVVFLVNNLGSVPAMEMQVIAKCIADRVFASKEGPFAGDKRIYMLVGTFMTSLDMNGMSISACMMDDELEQLLLTECEVEAWRKPFRVRPPSGRNIYRLGTNRDPEQFRASNAEWTTTEWIQTEAVVRQILRALQAEVDTLTLYDKKVGDGDFGITLSRGITQVEKDLGDRKYDLTQPATFFKRLADALCASMGGTSGALFSIFFTAASASFAKSSSWCESFRKGTAAVMKHGGAVVGDRTMVDALAPAADKIECLSDAAEAAKIGAENTAMMAQAKAGRSEYVSKENLQGIPDPGAVAVSIALESIANALS